MRGLPAVGYQLSAYRYPLAGYRIPGSRRGRPPLAEGRQSCAYARAEGCVPKGETTHYILCVAGAPSRCVRCASLLSGGESGQWRLNIFPDAIGFRRLRRPGSSRHRASPWAAPVPPTERAGSEGVLYAACGNAPPLVAGATAFLHGKASHTILRSLALPYESCSLATPLRWGHYGCWAVAAI